MTLAPPNAELVGQAWLHTYAGLPAAMIAGALAKPEKWTNDSFVTVRALAAGTANAELSERRTSVVQIDAWATKATSARPLWGVALTLMERIRIATFRDAQPHGRAIEMPVSGFTSARVLGAYLTREPVRVENDPSAYARVTCDLAVDWTA